MTSFFLAGAEQQLREHPLLKISRVIDWQSLLPLLKGIHKRDTSCGGGPTPYEPLVMLRATLLGQWHTLSDADLEHALSVRLDFLLFCGFDMGQALPDASTLCRFRNRLHEINILDRLLREINRQLQEHGLMIKGARGAIVDATIIQSAARPDRVIETLPDESVQVNDSADVDARWTKKGNTYHFGYRGYMAVEAQEGFVEAVTVKPANQAETKVLDEVLDQLPVDTRSVLADKGYASAANRDSLARRGLKDGILYKAQRGHPLTAAQKTFNRFINAKRFRVEQVFGTLKRKFKLNRARYFGIAKVQAQATITVICFNLLKASRKIFTSHPLGEHSV